ncbi:hypothetical protein SASPL_104407 [Salvia splendens]|uniref:Uncharacterized protein n=1 Tax=Salvia splendens TaxID=180675 RepID=A0A8X8YJD8_SALSN|nr:hypothetical protein SASPL_104407 [Salvia splendens]
MISVLAQVFPFVILFLSKLSHGFGQFVYSFHAYCFCILISAQERLLGAALGSLLTGAVVFEQRRSIYKSINHYEPRLTDCPNCLPFSSGLTLVLENDLGATNLQPTEPIFGRKSRQEFAHMWNNSVDSTFGPMIEYLSSRGW